MYRTLILTVVIGFVAPCAVLCSHAGSSGDNWPSWRGPDFTGVSAKGNPPVTWSDTENIKWKMKVPGVGTSSPVIWGDKIFFLTAIKTDKTGTPVPRVRPVRPQTEEEKEEEEDAEEEEEDEDEDAEEEEEEDAEEEEEEEGPELPTNYYKFDVVCVDRGTGKILWQKTAREELPHEAHHEEHGFASYSPVTDGKYVWASFGSRGTHCYDLDGNHKWSRDLGKMDTIEMFGEGSSPVLAGDALIVLMDQESNSKIYALNKMTGKIIWEQKREEYSTWTTPVVAEVDGNIQVIAHGVNYIRSYDAGTGNLVWQCKNKAGNSMVSPIYDSGTVYYTNNGDKGALSAIRLGNTGDLTGTDAICWEAEDVARSVGTPILYGGRIFACPERKAKVLCLDAKTGEKIFEAQPLKGIREMYASPAGAGGHVYFVGRKGTVVVIKQSDKFEVVATNVLDDAIDASPAIVGDELYLKGSKYLYCIAD